MIRTFIRGISTKPRRILLSKDESCFVSYHPDTEHEYQYTKPLPKVEVGESLLKVDSKNMIVKSPNLEQLQTLTFTHARHWRSEASTQRRRKYKERFNDNVDRFGLTS